MTTQTPVTTQADLTPAAPESRTRFHVTYVCAGEDQPRLLDGMFGYAVQKVAEDEAAAHNRAEAKMAEKEGREVQEVFYVTRSTMTFEVLDPEQTGAES